MSAATERTCPDCGIGMEPIRVLERGGGPQYRADLAYSTADAKPSWITGAIPIEGNVSACVCPSCGLIRLYAVPMDRPAELTPAATPEGYGSEPTSTP